jgi:hypothetical protein
MARSTLQQIHDAEDRDVDGQRWPRSKLHDDKTFVAITFHIRAQE